MDMNTVQAFFNKADAFASHNGMTLTEVCEGYAKAEMLLQPYHMNGAGTVHGGALFTLADFAFAAASNSRGQLALSINSSISIFKGAKEGKLIAEAREVSHSPKLASFEVSVRNEAGHLLATFQGMVYRKSVLLESLLPASEKV
ncbi:MAG: phenylacetic acid degradation-related protein [Proteobacteria bacterium]|nr:phenylacetic acid degradation-related protein [Pseudomonadota bacterium]